MTDEKFEQQRLETREGRTHDSHSTYRVGQVRQVMFNLSGLRRIQFVEPRKVPVQGRNQLEAMYRAAGRVGSGHQGTSVESVH